MPVARIESSLGFNDTAFEQGIARAEKRAQSFAGKVEASFQGLFKRTPGRKAEKALTGLVADLSSGDLSSAITSFANRFTGLGLAAGVGVGVAIELFQKFKGQIDETNKAGEALRQAMLQPIVITTSLSAEGMGKVLEQRKALGADLTEKSQNRAGSVIKETFQSLIGSFGLTGAGKDIGKDRVENEKTLNKNLQDQATIMEAQANLSARIVGLKMQEVDGDEHGAKIAKILLDTEQARAELKTKGLTTQAQRTADEALTTSAGIDISQEQKRFDIKQASLAIEERMAALISKGLAPADQKKVRAGLELKNIDQQLATEKNPDRIRALNLERLNKTNEMRSFGSMPGANSGPEWGSIAKREGEVNDPNVWGSLGASAANRGEIAMQKTTSENPEVVKAVGETNRILTEVFLK